MGDHPRVSAAYSPSEWSELFVATAGATAALTGLVFVAVSLNIERILKLPGLPERALQTLMMLLTPLIVSLVGLIPGQSATALGVELLVLGVLATYAIVQTLRRTIPGGREHQRASFHMAMTLPAAIPVVIGGASLIAGWGGGLYWIVAAIVCAILGASVNAWVLLVEILR
jgi:hypothetical protein